MSAPARQPSNPAVDDRWYEHDAAAYRRFLAASRAFWATELFQAVRRQTASADAARTSDAGFEAFVLQHPTYQAFAWLERHLQRMRYSGPLGLVESARRRREEFVESLSSPLPEGLLSLDPDLAAPAYYAACDIHQHPGGLGGDPLAGVVYRSATAAGVVGRPRLHERFARLATSGRRVTRVLDLGCGFGRSTCAFAEAAPAARVHGIDLSAGCLQLAAHALPAGLRSRVTFAQADALASGLPAEGFDLVTSTMLLHEMPEDAVRALIAETGRLTAPGGAVIHLDFLPPADPLLRILFAGHARRNNEPFLLDHSRIDLAEAYTSAGFRHVEAIAFAEEDGALDASAPSWRLPWTMIVAQR